LARDSKKESNRLVVETSYTHCIALSTHVLASDSQQSFDGSKKVKTSKQKMAKTYNSGYSPVVTHLTTNPPVSCLNIAERTGSIVFKILWSYVEEN
jgi:hypothetical protein